MLVLAGHDPGGGAGIQADIETLFAHGVHGLPLIACLTVQDSTKVHSSLSVDSSLLRQQADCLLADVQPAAIKIGMLGSPENARLAAELAASLPSIPLVLDPILAAGGGGAQASSALIETLLGELLPRTRLLTPNSIELARLVESLQRVSSRRGSGEPPLAEQARMLLDQGCEALLVTGSHASTPEVINRLFLETGECVEWRWPRLPDSPHGSGCTLASAITARLALGEPLADAVAMAQCYTWEALRLAWRAGSGQRLPSRSLTALGGVVTDGMTAAVPGQACSINLDGISED